MKKILLFCSLLLAATAFIPLDSIAQKDSIEISGRSVIVRTARYNHYICPVTSVMHNYSNNIITIRGGNNQVETVWASNVQKIIINGVMSDFSIVAHLRQLQMIADKSTLPVDENNPNFVAVSDPTSNEYLNYIQNKLPDLGQRLSAGSVSITPASDIVFPSNVTFIGNSTVATNSGTATNGTLRTCEAQDAPTYGSTTAATAPTRMQLQGGVYYSSLPTLTTGQSVGAVTDINGRRLVSIFQQANMTQTASFITTGNVSQTCLNSNTSRTGFEIINTSASTLYISFSGAATTASIPITAGTRYSRWDGKMPTNAITILGATSGLTYITLEIN